MALLSRTSWARVLSFLVTSGATSKCPGGNPVPGAGKALYLITNDEANGVVSLRIAADGQLSPGSVTPTNGAGSVALNSDNQPATPDALVSQSALTVVGNFVFAVNAGSNTLSMLSISPSDPTRLSLIGTPVAVTGEFPNTVTASLKNRLVCVGTSGKLAGVSCAKFSRNQLGAMDALRPFDLGQTTPPVGPTNTVSQVFFSADESTVFATVKGDPPTNKTGFISSFPVTKMQQRLPQGRMSSISAVSTQEQRSSPAGTAVLFGSQSIPGNGNGSKVFATDASFGAAVLSVNPSTGEATVLGKGTVQGQKATCWATISAKTGTAFVTDVGVNRIVEMSLTDASILGEIDLSKVNNDPGLIDLRASDDFVYALSPGNGTTPAAVTVFRVSGDSAGKRQVQHFELVGLAGSRAMGMAVRE
ncbi:hypothetical protein V8F33_008482 [Rhypophila sp. PSN 637]